MRSFPVGRQFTATLIGALSFSVFSACDSGPVDPTSEDPGSTLTVDASSTANWALVALGSPAQVLGAVTPGSSTAWDLGFQTTSVIANGGANGPGGVVAYCICQNATATTDEVMAFTPESEEADFQAVTAAQIPAAGDDWSADAFDENRWYWYNPAEHVIYPRYNVYLVKRGTTVYKVQLTGYYGPTGTDRQVSFRYAKLTD